MDLDGDGLILESSSNPKKACDLGSLIDGSQCYGDVELAANKAYLKRMNDLLILLDDKYWGGTISKTTINWFKPHHEF